jgi:hypothetical protein
MAVISVSDFSNWKQDNVTKAYFAAVRERIDDAKEVLSTSAGLDACTDNWYRGFIAGQRDMLAVSIEEMEGGQE